MFSLKYMTLFMFICWFPQFLQGRLFGTPFISDKHKNIVRGSKTGHNYSCYNSTCILRLLHRTSVHNMKQMLRNITHTHTEHTRGSKKGLTSSALIIPEHELSLHPGSDQMREMSLFDRQCRRSSLPVI